MIQENAIADMESKLSPEAVARVNKKVKATLRRIRILDRLRSLFADVLFYILIVPAFIVAVYYYSKRTHKRDPYD
jgi:hypothetical protein